MAIIVITALILIGIAYASNHHDIKDIYKDVVEFDKRTKALADERKNNYFMEKAFATALATILIMVIILYLHTR